MFRVASQEQAERQNELMRASALPAWYVMMSIPTDKKHKKPTLSQFIKQLQLDQPVWKQSSRAERMSKADIIAAGQEAEDMVRNAFSKGGAK